MQATEQRSMQRHLFEHFSSKGHSGFVDDVFIFFIDKTDPNDPNKRERYWWHKLKTINFNVWMWGMFDSCSLVCLVFCCVFYRLFLSNIVDTRHV